MRFAKMSTCRYRSSQMCVLRRLGMGFGLLGLFLVVLRDVQWGSVMVLGFDISASSGLGVYWGMLIGFNARMAF